MTLKQYQLEPDCDVYSLEGFSKLGYEFVHRVPTFSIDVGQAEYLAMSYVYAYAIRGGMWAVCYLWDDNTLYVGTAKEIDAHLVQRLVPQLDLGDHVWFYSDRADHKDMPELLGLNAQLLARELETT